MASATDLDPAARSQRPAFALRQPVREIAFVGDSTLADLRLLGYDYSDTVTLVASAMPIVSGSTGIRVVNRSRPGLGTKFLAGPEFSALGPHIRAIFTPGSDLPDLVVIPISSIDLSAVPDRTVDSLAPELIAELRRVQNYLTGLGVQTVFTPVFGANGTMYNELRNALQPTFRDYRLSQRINRYNELLRSSGLPLLITEYRGFDLDGDSEPDRRFFSAWLPGVLPDDGVHPNDAGQRLYAANLADGLAAAFEAARR